MEQTKLSGRLAVSADLHTCRHLHMMPSFGPTIPFFRRSWRSMSEKLCLKWNDFHENVNTAFGNLREDTEFADVTLACEDGQQIEAHKVILAASSLFFQNLGNS